MEGAIFRLTAIGADSTPVAQCCCRQGQRKGGFERRVGPNDAREAILSASMVSFGLSIRGQAGGGDTVSPA